MCSPFLRRGTACWYYFTDTLIVTLIYCFCLSLRSWSAYTCRLLILKDLSFTLKMKSTYTLD